MKKTPVIIDGKEYLTMTQAAKAVGITKSEISRAVKYGYRPKGHTVKLKEP